MKRILLVLMVLCSGVLQSQIKFTYVNPATNEIRIKNFGATAVDITNYRFCALFEYANIPVGNVSIVTGDLNLAQGEEVAVSWNSSSGFNTSASDVGLYLPTGAFSSASSMVDFMQYGAGGQGRENVAVSAGLWTAGEFLTGTGPWYYIGSGAASGLDQWSDIDPASGPYTEVRINELDPDQPSTDTQEFIELFGAPGEVLDGLVIVFFNGSDNMSYASYDLDGEVLDENGFFVLGTALVPNVDMELLAADNNIQNGADGVAIYVGDGSAWPGGIMVTSTGLIDAVVYGTDDSPATTLIDTLIPGQSQLNTSANDALSFSRIPDGGDALDMLSYFSQDPTPGASNVPDCTGGNISVTSGTTDFCSDEVNAPLNIATTSIFGDNYLYFLTTEMDVIVASSTTGEFDMNGMGDGTYHVWGFSYNGLLDAASIAEGLPLSGVTSNDCYSLSQNFLTVVVTSCSADTCEGGVLSVVDSNSYISICSDGNADEYTFDHTIGGNADGYGYLVVDAVGGIVLFSPSATIDLNALPVGDYYVHGIAYFTGLDPNTIEAGDPITGVSTLGTCLDLSDNAIEVHVLSCAPVEGCTRLYISEYIEGNSNDKAIEIYNPTPFPVSLDDYDLFAYANGGLDFTAVVGLTGTIQPGDVYVIANSQASAGVLAEADMTAGLATFNGNDALVLTYNLEAIDVIGIVGNDPGINGWQFGLGSTVDHTLVRKLEVNAPTTDWVLSQGQWDVYGSSDITHLGNHNALACSGEAFVTFEAAAMQVEEDAGTVSITIHAYNVSVDVPITVDISGASAIEGQDFTTSVPVTLTFTPLNNEQTITLNIIDDLDEETLYEYITFTMSDDMDLATFVNQSITVSIAPSDQDYPFYTIAEVTEETTDGLADSLNVFCTITGIVHGINFNPAGTEFTLIQGNAGIKVFDADENFGYTVVEGDSILVLGQITQFMGMTEIFPDQIIYVDGGHTPETPALVTTLTEAHESRMVRMQCVELVDPTQWVQTGSGFDVELTDGTNQFTMHVDLNTDIFPADAPEGHFNVIGIGGQADADSPFDGNYVFWPRMLTDMNGFIIASFTPISTIVYGLEGAGVQMTNESTGGVSFEWDFGDGNTSVLTDPAHTYTYAFLSGISDVDISLSTTDAFGCTDVYTETVEVIFTSLDEMSRIDFNCYPNPANDQIWIRSGLLMSSLCISDAMGNTVLRFDGVNRENIGLDISGLSAGVYHISVFTESGSGERTFVKQ
ncbi:MAG: lamin tail domain-containing protein [Flavobacteriales bacterium]|nr:lamin tail domain-containing protein [Flavobacteriales bacterium]